MADFEKIINKYRETIATKIECSSKDIVFSVQPRGNGPWEILGTLAYQKNEFCVGHFMIQNAAIKSEGDFRGDKNIALFKLYEMPHCCGIVVSCNAEVGKLYRRKGIGRLMNSFRLEIAKQLGYSLILCTDLLKNEPQRKILEKQGWKDIHRFNNSRTKNDLYISIKDI